MITRKHFIAIANIVKTKGYDPYTRDCIAKGLADEFATINPNFDRDRFLTACGVEA